MKDKSGVVAVDEFVGLMLKMYSFLAHKNEHNRNKEQIMPASLSEQDDLQRAGSDSG